jgi:hypothetical protein
MTNNRKTYSELLNLFPTVKRKFNRTAGFRRRQGITLIHSVTENVTSPSFTLCPESIMYLFHIDAIAKNLLFYLIFYHVDFETCLVRVDDSTKFNFLDYCQRFSKTYKYRTIKSALDKLVKANILLSVERYKYMLNPVVAGPLNDTKRRNLIRDYSKLLIEKGKDGNNDFYPAFK